MRNIDLRAAYTKIYENRMAAMTAGESEGKKAMRGSGAAKPTGGKSYTMKGKDGKPLFDKKEEVEAEGEQIDEVAPIIAAGVGKLAGGLAAKAGAGAAAKAGGGIAKAAGSKLGKAALTKGGEMVGNKVTQKMSEESELEEGAKHDDERHRMGSGGSVRQGSQLPLKNLKPMKRQEAGEPAASDNKAKGKKVANTTKVPRGTPTQPKRLAKDGPKDHVRGKEHMSKVDMKDPATKKAIEKMAADEGAKKLAKKAAYKNAANKLEKQRRDDLDKRYGPKKEELEAYLIDSGIVESNQSASLLITHMSDDWYETILDELYEG